MSTHYYKCFCDFSHTFIHLFVIVPFIICNNKNAVDIFSNTNLTKIWQFSHLNKNPVPLVYMVPDDFM